VAGHLKQIRGASIDSENGEAREESTACEHAVSAAQGERMWWFPAYRAMDNSRRARRALYTMPPLSRPRVCAQLVCVRVCVHVYSKG
jgi:hypothetical protein